MSISIFIRIYENCIEVHKEDFILCFISILKLHFYYVIDMNIIGKYITSRIFKIPLITKLNEPEGREVLIIICDVYGESHASDYTSL